METTERLDLSAIKARVEAASLGPWQWEACTEDGMINEVGEVLSAGGMHTEGFVYVSDSDADFIAHARTDVPALLAEVERLRAEVERLTVIDDYCAENHTR